MSALIPLLANAGTAGVVLALFILGYIYPKRVVDDLRTALAAERQRADAAVASAAVTRDLLLALRGGLSLEREEVAEDEKRRGAGKSRAGTVRKGPGGGAGTRHRPPPADAGGQPRD